MSITVLWQRELCVSYTKVIYTLNLSLDIGCKNSKHFYQCACPVIDHQFHHNIVKVAVDPRGDIDVIILALPAIVLLRIVGMEIQGFRNGNSSQTNANLYYSNSYSELIPNERAPNNNVSESNCESNCRNTQCIWDWTSWKIPLPTGY